MERADELAAEQMAALPDDPGVEAFEAGQPQPDVGAGLSSRWVAARKPVTERSRSWMVTPLAPRWRRPGAEHDFGPRGPAAVIVSV